MARRQRYYNSNGDKPNSSSEYANEPQNWNQSHIDGIIDFMVNDMYYNGHVGYRCQGVNSAHPNHVFHALQTYPNAGGDLSPFLLSNGAINPLAKNQIISSILNLCQSGGVPDTHYSLACENCPVETIIEGVDSKGRDIMVQGCEYYNNSNYITRVLENGTWYNLGLPSIYHNMPMYPGGCPSSQASSSGGVSSGGVSSGGVSSGTTRPTRPKKDKNNRKRNNRMKDIEKACKKCDSLRLKYGMKKQEPTKKLSATGCSSCGSNFTGDSKPCSCGRNPGGSCQCNSGGSSARMGHGVSQPISMPVMASASGKRPNGMPMARENRDCDKRCPHCPDGDVSMNNGPCNHRGECCDKRVFTPQGLAPGQRLSFPNNQAIKKYDMLKFSNFVSKVKSNGRKNFVNPTNFGAAEDETFAYNPRVVKEFSTNTKGFFDKSDLNNYSF